MRRCRQWEWRGVWRKDELKDELVFFFFFFFFNISVCIFGRLCRVIG